MPTLPLIDLMILLGWTSLFVGATQKAIWITTAYRPTIFTLTPIDFLWIAGICLLFALSLAARTWVKVHEGEALALGRTHGRSERRRRVREVEGERVDLDQVAAARD